MAQAETEHFIQVRLKQVFFSVFLPFSSYSFVKYETKCVPFFCSMLSWFKATTEICFLFHINIEPIQ